MMKCPDWPSFYAWFPIAFVPGGGWGSSASTAVKINWLKNSWRQVWRRGCLREFHLQQLSPRRRKSLPIPGVVRRYSDGESDRPRDNSGLVQGMRPSHHPIEMNGGGTPPPSLERFGGSKCLLAMESLRRHIISGFDRRSPQDSSGERFPTGQPAHKGPGVLSFVPQVRAELRPVP